MSFLPFRGDKVALAYDDAAGWACIQAHWKEYGPYYRRGPAKDVVKLLDGTPFPATAPAIEAKLLAVLDYRTRRHTHDYPPADAWFARRWVAAGGLPFALQVLAAKPAVEPEVLVSSTADKHTMTVGDGDGSWWSLEEGDLHALYPLRTLSAVASKSDYAAGVAAATELRATAKPWFRAAIAFMFPDEVAFATADLALARGKPPKKPPAKPKALPAWSYGLLTTKLPDEAGLRDLLFSLSRDGAPWTTGTQDYGFTLVHRFGKKAAPLLQHALVTLRAKTAKHAFTEALAAATRSS